MSARAIHGDADAPGPQAQIMPYQSCGFFVSEYFRKVLYLERKRCERSRRPMYLLLIDVTKLPTEGLDEAVWTISRQLASSTRETDIKGWYSEGRILGVIFTEHNIFDREKVTKKIKDSLTRELDSHHLEKLGFAIHDFPHGERKDQEDTSANPLLYPEVREKYAARKGPFLVKRLMDIVGSIIGLVLFSPIFVIASVLIKLSSPGPVLFRQERVGLYGKRFTFLKFRTMYVNNDPKVHQEYVKSLIVGKADAGNGGNGNEEDASSRKPVFKIQNDKRITPIGNILRKSSLDELPQFVNVLLGDMSLVGPRPPIPYEVQDYDIWHRSRIFEVKPGITGLWQVMGRSSTSFDEMVRLDIKYSREWTLWLDIKILFMTPWAVLRGKGAY